MEKKKIDEAKQFEKKILQAVDCNMDIVKKIESQTMESLDDEYEATIRGVLENIPDNKLVRFVTTIHIIIASYKKNVIYFVCKLYY